MLNRFGKYIISWSNIRIHTIPRSWNNYIVGKNIRKTYADTDIRN